jgi:hypothetical protein
MVNQHRAVPYERDDPTSYEWTVKAYDLAVDGTIQAWVRQVGGIRVATFDGPCPRCNGTFMWNRTLDTVVGTSGTLGSPEFAEDSYVPLEIGCECGIYHTGADKDVKNCGVIFRIDVKRPADE